MSSEKNKKNEATRRLSSEEVNKHAKTKPTKSSSETQVVGKVNLKDDLKKSKNKKNENKDKKKKKKFKDRQIGRAHV